MTKDQYKRNRGFIGSDEQKKLNEAKVAIAGTGGDGGRLAISLARMGVSNFHLADPEKFEIENLNRQEGSFQSTIGQNKAEVVKKLIKDINPAAKIKVFPKGVSEKNLSDFLDGVTLVADEMEFTMHWLGVMLARACRKRNIPVVMGFNVGFGCLVTSFSAKGRTLESVLGLSAAMSMTEIKAANVPLRRWVPRIPSYVDPAVLTKVQNGELDAPSVVIGVDIAAGATATEAFNHITGRRQPVLAPKVLWVDVLERRSGVVRFPAASFYASVSKLSAKTALGMNPKLDIS